ncbi:MAG: PASTA domain-containing protein [Gemmatimonadaceae bacterium]|nr:PASTA domain-containing protein [Gemmatimonadaceae bacterium]
MTPTVLAESTRLRRLRELVTKRPILSTAIGGFVLGFLIVAAVLVPGAFMKSESAVPNVVGLLYADAAARLNAAGFKAKTGESLNHATAPKNSVLGQSPAPGIKALKGNDVILDVSLGAKRGTVPNVVGMPRDEAVKALEAAGFEVSDDYTERLDQHPRGEVLATTPRIGSTVTQPASVRLTISAGPDAVGVPSLVGMPVDDALALLGQLGLFAGEPRSDSTGSQPEGIVSNQRPAANTPAAPGSTVTLTVSHPRAPRDSATP